jgi:SnoaL-like domain
VASAAKRARATLARELPPPGQREAPPPPHSPAEQRLVAGLTRAFEAGDVDAIVALLTEDAWLRMPPVPLEYRGRELATQFLTLAFRNRRRYRLVATRANGQPAFGMYVYDRHAPVLHANGLIVLTLAGDQISTITRFDAGVLPRFGLPRSLPR